MLFKRKSERFLIKQLIIFKNLYLSFFQFKLGCISKPMKKFLITYNFSGFGIFVCLEYNTSRRNMFPLFLANVFLSSLLFREHAATHTEEPSFSAHSRLILPPRTSETKEKVLNGYSRFLLPPKTPVKLTVNLALYELIDFDVTGESIHCLFWQRNTWIDHRLKWTLNERELGTIFKMIF